MNQFKLILISLLCAVFSAPPGFTTANAAADVAADVEDLKGQVEKMRTDYEAQIAKLSAQNAELAKQVGAPAAEKDPLGLGGLQLPPGVELKDVIWRKEAGLTTKQAVAAALAQVRFDKARKAQGAKAAEKKGTKGS